VFPSSQFGGVPDLQFPEAHLLTPLQTLESSQSVLSGRETSLGQLALEPLQTSEASQAPTAVRH